MQGRHQKQFPFAEVGKRLRDLREAKGMTRGDLARLLNANVSSLAVWESGKHLPRERMRVKIGRVLGTDASALFAVDETCTAQTIAVSVFDTIEDLEEILLGLATHTRAKLRALRLAAPYVTSAHIQTSWRKLVSERLLDGTLEVNRIEIFYDLRRLQEVVSNVFRYDGKRYYVKSYCAGVSDVVPAIGGYFFDDDEFVLGGYWASVPPHNQPSLRVSGAPFRTFFNAYWEEIWRRGVLLNIRGAHDLGTIRTIALKLGLKPEDWDEFIKQAKSIEIGDGAPPLV